jgi:hypothetical protein
MPEAASLFLSYDFLLPLLVSLLILGGVAAFRVWTYRRLRRLAERNDSRYHETVALYAQTAERHDQMIALLTQIRDRLPEARA